MNCYLTIDNLNYRIDDVSIPKFKWFILWNLNISNASNFQNKVDE
jgi:hypothetical protein